MVVMEQHPIPQQISSYEFRLVGDMTLKQFVKVALGVLAAYFVYHSRFIFLLRLPLAFAFLALGIGTAFFPLNNRPLEFWLLAFLKAVYSPTIFIWKKPFAPHFFSQIPAANAAEKVISPPSPKTTAPPPISFNKQAPPPQKLVQSTVVSKPSPVKSPPPSSAEILKMIRQTPSSSPTPSTAPAFLKTPLPATPTTPNIISGLVLDDQGKILEGAIVEIQDPSGNSIRAMRTNLLGQFQTATPLPNGKYLLLVEKEPYQFDIIKIEAKGEIIPPLQIRAKKPTAN